MLVYGLLEGRSAAWKLAIIVSIISIVKNAISNTTGNISSIANILLNGIIHHYLYRPYVKKYFAKI